ncbi:MAG: 16S rRNA (adenine(1518)-N(6)/adenine(1519)-N(6))-dimethyltransferase RsmA [Chlorobi bacterium]|nr:16S rRNA (adenine(1518)-N(6)/adenine(1519)-N(6))-dimethyltransferase RsmA [Chlorobiota bacterium]MCI0716818.1 16S rRNA (adenine(1518)-N(6)/adenine(1519)-N(6))-dimethyltransferase RsmA [Chlorobiota bacterium]
MTRIKHFPRKSLGQNYLIDENICRNIVNSFDIKESDNVIEIGPGQGAITKYIIEKTKNLTVIELDEKNCKILSKKFPDLKILNNDFLKLEFYRIEILQPAKGGTQNFKFRIIGNIPYNVTSEIIFKLIDNRHFVADAQLMVQEEVAQRLTGKPNTKEYGIPSVLVQVFSKPKLLFKVSRSCFYPIPGVDSRIIHFDFNHSLENTIKDVVFFKKLVRAAFGTRRKTLKNSLKSLKKDLNKINFDFSRRAENLTVNEFITLNNLLC